MNHKSDKLNLLIRKNKGKELIPLIKTELENITSSSKLVTLEESDEIIERVKTIQYNNLVNFKINSLIFTNKIPLKCVFDLIAKVDFQHIYISLGYSEYCGLAETPSINSFNTDFSFNAEHTGLIVLYSSDIQNKLLLDFYEEAGGKFLDIEVYGELWSKASIICNKLI